LVSFKCLSNCEVNLHLAQWWSVNEDGRIRCELCPRHCLILPGQTGSCRVRKNIDGQLYSLVYGQPIAIHIDPIEKKPLYHFQPGSRVFSLGTVGCNLRCSFCQNWDISTASPQEYHTKPVEPEALVQKALVQQCQSIAFTYNEPTILGEYVLDIAKAARAANLKTIMVTNGFITTNAIADIYPWIDGANIDLKAFSEEYYRKMCGGNLASVLEAIKTIFQVGTFIELTTLLIPGLNDSPTELSQLTDWICANLGTDVPLHFSAFHPDYQLLDRPATSKHILDKAVQLARSSGLNYVYEGNVATTTEGNTYCPQCGRLLIERHFYFVEKHNLEGNRCVCGKTIPLVL